MGAWGYGIFEDDMACDFVEDVKENSLAFFQQAFSQVLETEYVEFEEGQAILVSAAYLDNWLHGTQYKNDYEGEEEMSNVNVFGKLYPDLNLEPLRKPAIVALQQVLSDKSELNELWQENEELYFKWKGQIKAIIGRLEKE